MGSWKELEDKVKSLDQSVQAYNKRVIALDGELQQCNHEITRVRKALEDLLCLYRQDHQKLWYQKILERWWHPAIPKIKPSQPLSIMPINPVGMLPPKKWYPNASRLNDE